MAVLTKTNLERGTRICKHCGEEKAFSEFWKNRSDPVAGVQYGCKTCQTQARRDRHAADPTYYRDKQYKVLYGISYEVYEQMLIDQGEVCAICQRPETKTSHGKLRPLSVDHDHDTGIVRGLLCQSCNAALGLFEDDLDILSNAMTYIESYRKGEGS